MSKRRNEETGKTFEVGYGRPPKGTQFQKGQSGNPTGRRKDAEKKRVESRETIASLIAREGQRLVTYIKDGKTFRAPTIDVIIRRLHQESLNGNINAAKMALLLHKKVELENPPLMETPDFSEMSQEKIAKWYKKWAATPTNH